MSSCYLVICDEDHAGSKVGPEAAIWKSVNLVLHTLITANMDRGLGPPLGHG